MSRTIIHIVPGNAMGGAQRYALDVCRHFADAGCRVIALTRDAKAIDRQFELAAVPLRHAPLRDYPDFFSSLILKNIFLEEGRETESIVVHCHRYRDALTAILARKLARRPGIRIIMTRHVAAPAKKNWLRRFIYRQVDTHIFGSEFARNEFLAAWPHGRYPFDPARFLVAFDSRNIGINFSEEPSRGAITAMYHGTLRPGKGLQTLLHAFARLKDTRMRLKIIGTGDTDFIDSLRRLAITLGVMESIDWKFDPADPATFISSCHFGVLPSETPEACGMSNIEYMAAGRPQICSFNGPRGEYLTPGVEALAVEPGDVEALADAMRRLFDDRELRLKMGAAARKTFEQKLSWQIFINHINKAYGYGEN